MRSMGSRASTWGAALLLALGGCTVTEKTEAEDTTTPDTADTATETDTLAPDTADTATGGEDADVAAPSCEAVTLAGALTQHAERATDYVLGGDVDLGFGGSAADRLVLELYSSESGTFDLASPVNANYATCEQCVRVYEGLMPRHLFHRAGTITVDGTPGEAEITVTLTDLVLEEVTIEDGTFVSTPVPGGACYEVAGPVTLTSIADCAPNCPDACGSTCADWQSCNEVAAMCEDVGCVLDQMNLGGCVLQ